MPSWLPDWQKLMADAPEIEVKGRKGYVYLIADSHLGDARAPTGPFFEMLHALPEARMVIFLGDLFKVWLAMPKFWDDQIRLILAGFAELRRGGVPILFVVGNREYFLPAGGGGASGLPFDHIVPGACTLRWGARRYGLTHGDIINRNDLNHLKWRRLSRSRWFEWLFRALPGRQAFKLARWLERTLAKTNVEVKSEYPLGEIEAFARTVLGDLDALFVGHFHRDEVIALPDRRGEFRIVPDWHSRKCLLRLDADGAITHLNFGEGQPGTAA